MFDFKPAEKKTLYFIGVTTASSSIMRVFPKWAKALGLGDVAVCGIDLPLHAPGKDYRDVVRFLKEDPLSCGALVTTHKLDLFAACRDIFDYIDPYAEKLSEVSCLSKRGGMYRAHAKDPISSGLSIESFLPHGFWEKFGGEALILGAGGSSLAMSLYFGQEKWGANVPRRITIANRSLPRLEHAAVTLERLNPGIEMRYLHCPAPTDNDRLVEALPSHSLIVNATGLGKDAPGSPVTDAVVFPEESFVWEINYRGDLVFKEQADRQARERRLRVEDGWTYFIHGWTQVIAEAFDVPIEGETLERLGGIAKEA
ncbi:MAG: shikimate dehydrogenase [Clostridiales Family XIII bacterium]|jgi:shikimate 5-dehydrogenase|nr:shikimate dehydrogenase [Clostridiales Family XIII bacterium]